MRRASLSTVATVYRFSNYDKRSRTLMNMGKRKGRGCYTPALRVPSRMGA
jgi:hypothetical protein